MLPVLSQRDPSLDLPSHSSLWTSTGLRISELSTDTFPWAVGR